MEADVLVDAINTLLALLPEPWKARAEALLALMSALSIAVAIYRPIMARLAPNASNHPVMVWFDRSLDWLVANSRRLEVRKPVTQARLFGAPPKRKSAPPGPPYDFLLLLAFLPGLSACGASAIDTTRATLNSLQAVADPAYETAMDLCTTQLEAISARLKADGYKPAYEAEQQAVDARCEKTRRAFEVIRGLHRQAVAFVKDGRVEEAQAVIAQLMAAWGRMRPGVGP